MTVLTTHYLITSSNWPRKWNVSSIHAYYLCLIFDDHLDKDDVVNQISKQVLEKVPLTSSALVLLGSSTLKARDPNDPLVHYLEFVDIELVLYLPAFEFWLVQPFYFITLQLSVLGTYWFESIIIFLTHFRSPPIYIHYPDTSVISIY